jgi:PTH1 family peptidyl-tRNA hydrolase
MYKEVPFLLWWFWEYLGFTLFHEDNDRPKRENTTLYDSKDMRKLLNKLGERVSIESSKTYLIVGLGNPGNRYKNNRHNVGFMVLDEIAKKLNTQFSRIQSNALVTKGEYKGDRLILSKPRTYMNVSGQPIRSLVKFYKIPLENLIITFDDADLPFETIRVRPDGGSSGHKGMESIIHDLGSNHFNRLRVGIGRPPGKMKTPDYVLKDFSKNEMELLPMVLDRASDAVLMFVAEGIDAVMNKYNRTGS